MSLPINPIAAVVSTLCYNCGQPTSQCAECAVTIEVDPTCGLPIDYVMGPDLTPVKVPRDQVPEEVLQRAQPRFICDDCVALMNGKRDPDQQLTSATARHARQLCANWGLV